MLRFTKMHGLGNDFVVIDAINQTVDLSPEQIRFLADRHHGIGCDQLLLVRQPEDQAHDFRYIIYNADGSEVEQCGNGVRCFARFVYDQGLTSKKITLVETAGGLVSPQLLDDGQVKVDMGAPNFTPASLPFSAAEDLPRHIITAAGRGVELAVCSVGNPHAVMQVENIDSADVATLGPAIESHELFPQRVNAGFAQVVSRQHIRLRVYERGAGETRACGTGACAAAVSMMRLDFVDQEVTVSLPGGDLLISWQADESIFMTGPTATVFSGEVDLPAL